MLHMYIDMKENDTFLTIIGTAHLFLAIFIGIYGFIFEKSWFDFVYLFYQLIVIFSWPFFNGECPLTYFIKKYRNPDYVMGEDSTDLEDMHLLFGSKTAVYLLMTVGILITPISYYIVFTRNHFPFYIYFPFCVSFLLYTFFPRVVSVKNQPELYQNIQNIFKVVFSMTLLLSLHFVYTNK